MSELLNLQNFFEEIRNSFHVMLFSMFTLSPSNLHAESKESSRRNWRSISISLKIFLYELHYVYSFCLIANCFHVSKRNDIYLNSRNEGNPFINHTRKHSKELCRKNSSDKKLMNSEFSNARLSFYLWLLYKMFMSLNFFLLLVLQRWMNTLRKLLASVTQ